ncbi:hypothetical protein D3C75_930010 [compost metagenome]
MSQLADGSRLAHAINSNEQNNCNSIRIFLQAVIIISAQQLHKLTGQNRLQLGSIFNPILLHFGTQILDKGHNSVYTHVCTN